MKVKKMTAKEYYDRKKFYEEEFIKNNPVDEEEKKKDPKKYKATRDFQKMAYTTEHLRKEVNSDVYRNYLSQEIYHKCIGIDDLEKELYSKKSVFSEENFAFCLRKVQGAKKAQIAAVEMAATIRKTFENEYDGLMYGMTMKWHKEALAGYKKKEYFDRAKAAHNKMEHAVMCEELRIMRCLLRLRKEYEEFISGKRQYDTFIEEEKNQYHEFANRIDNCFANLDLEKPILSQLMDTAKFIADNELPYDDDFLENEMVVHALVLKECMDTHEQRFKEFIHHAHYKGDYSTIVTTNHLAINLYLTERPEQSIQDAINFVCMYNEPYIVPKK